MISELPINNRVMESPGTVWNAVELMDHKREGYF